MILFAILILIVWLFSSLAKNDLLSPCLLLPPPALSVESYVIVTWRGTTFWTTWASGPLWSSWAMLFPTRFKINRAKRLMSFLSPHLTLFCFLHHTKCFSRTCLENLPRSVLQRVDHAAQGHVPWRWWCEENRSHPNCTVLHSLSGKGGVACENQVKHRFPFLHGAIPDPLPYSNILRRYPAPLLSLCPHPPYQASSWNLSKTTDHILS